MHSSVPGLLSGTWEPGLWCKENLQTIGLDCTNACCLVGCRRLVELNRSSAKFLVQVKSFRILGLRDENEKQDLMSSWSTNTGPRDDNQVEMGIRGAYSQAFVEELHKRHRITFGIGGDLWEQWKMQ